MAKLKYKIAGRARPGADKFRAPQEEDFPRGIKAFPAADMDKLLFAQMMQDTLDNSLAEELLSKQPELNGLYCTKTGAKIGHRPNHEIALVCHTYEDPQERMSILEAGAQNACSIAWLRTDKDNLSRLQIADPVGYFIYAGAYALNLPQSSMAQITNANLAKREAHAYLLDKGLAQDLRLIAANEYLTRLLKYNVSDLDLPWKSFWDLIEAMKAETLFPTIQKRFSTWILKHTRSAQFLAENLLALEGETPSQFKTRMEREDKRRKKEQAKRASLKEALDLFDLADLDLSILDDPIPETRPSFTIKPGQAIKPFKINVKTNGAHKNGLDNPIPADIADFFSSDNNLSKPRLVDKLSLPDTASANLAERQSTTIKINFAWKGSNNG